MDIRNIFKAISEQLILEFRKTAEVSHSGGKGTLREDAFSEFLGKHLPSRYGIGRGEVITPENRVSGQLDIIIYDQTHCPALLASSSHSVFPIESVYGAISMKSKLSSQGLEDAYGNISAFKKIISKKGFTHSLISGLSTGFSYPVPVTGIVAYGADRSLEAIAKQVKKLDENLPDLMTRPDFIAIIGVGIVGPRNQLRGDFNKCEFTTDINDMSQIRKTGRHTLLRLYLQILQELNTVTLRPLNLRSYDDMPRIIGPHRVGRHSRFGRHGDDRGFVLRLTERAIQEILSKSKPVTFKEHWQNRFESIEIDQNFLGNLDETVYEYNPNNLPPFNPINIQRGEEGSVYSAVPAFLPLPLDIDGKQYSVDVTALSEADGHLEPDPDFTFEELMSS